MEFLERISRNYNQECDFPASNLDERIQYYSENGGFSFGCASVLHCIIRTYKPSRIFEIGIGSSSLVISNALELNSNEGHESYYHAIDPYPKDFVRNIPKMNQLTESRVELLDPKIFRELQPNDLLFIDSSHQVKMGNDVNYLYLEVLPSLNPDVLVHIHDVGMPYDYPSAYYLNEKFRVCWTEQYLLQAFLCHNNRFNVLLGMANIMKNHRQNFESAFPLWNSDVHISTSSSF